MNKAYKAGYLEKNAARGDQLLKFLQKLKKLGLAGDSAYISQKLKALKNEINDPSTFAPAAQRLGLAKAYKRDWPHPTYPIGSYAKRLGLGRESFDRSTLKAGLLDEIRYVKNRKIPKAQAEQAGGSTLNKLLSAGE